MLKRTRFLGIELKSNTDTSEIWKALVERKLEQADLIEFTVADFKQLPASLEPFAHKIKLRFTSKIRWQDEQLGTTCIIHLQCDEETRKYVAEAKNLGEWVLGSSKIDRPEDPALYSCGACIMWTIAHESMVFVQVSEDEIDLISKNWGKLVHIFPYEDTSAPTRVERVISF